MKNKVTIVGMVLTLMMSAVLPCEAQTDSIQQNAKKGSLSRGIKKLQEKRLPKFFINFAKACNDVDSNYCVKVPYDAFIESRTSIDQEVLVVNTADDLHMKLASEVAFKTGPYIGYGPISVGYLFRLNPTGRRRNIDFNFGINTNLFNLDFVYRRTGGDFEFRELSYPGDDKGVMKKVVDKTIGPNLSNDLYNTLMSISLNWVPNHRKFSYKAATSYGCQQVKSAGSPIFGIGYTFQKLETDMSMLTSIVGLSYVADNGGETLYHSDPAFKAIVDGLKQCKNMEEALPGIKELVYKYKDVIIAPNNAVLKKMLFNSIPTTTRVYDWRLQLGYGYNWVLSRHFMIGGQLLACPGIKRFTADNSQSVALRLIRDYDFVQNYLEKYNINPNMDVDHTTFGCDVNARLCIRWFNKQWYAGATGVFNGYYYDHNNLTMNYRYWTIMVSAGYNFNLSTLFKKSHRSHSL